MLLDTYSRRKRQANKTGPDVFQYTDMPTQLRQQTLYAFEKIITASGLGNFHNDRDPWSLIVGIMREELGVVRLGKYMENPETELADWFRSEQRIEFLLDAVELMCRICLNTSRKRSREADTEKQIAKLNARFFEAQFGFQYVDQEIVQVSDQFAHKEIILPALALVNNARFATANEEYRKAHKEFRDGQFADCVTDCGKSLESVLKVISAERCWKGVNENSALAALIGAAVQNDLFPNYMETQITGLRSMLQGAGTVRNKDGAHGKGEQQSLDDRDLAAYQLHQTAAAIIFLAQR